MPIITSPEPSAGAVLSLVAAAAGLRVAASAPAVVAGKVPPPGAVIGWVLVADAAVPGGARIDPVFLAGGRAWTPDQFRGEFGDEVTVTVQAG